MPIRLADHDRERLADWFTDIALDRMPEALDATSDARHAHIERDPDSGLRYSGRVVLVLPEGSLTWQ